MLFPAGGRGDQRWTIRPTIEIASIVLLVLSLGSCALVSSKGSPAQAGDAYWESVPATGVGYQIIQKWHLEWTADGAPSLTPLSWPAQRGVEVSLAISGPRPTIEPSSGAAKAIAQALDRAALDLQNQGLEIRGLHLNLSEESSEVAQRMSQKARSEMDRWLAELYSGVRRRLGRGMELSVSLAALDKIDLEREISVIGNKVDWVLAPTYGQQFNADDEPRLWDLEAALDRLRVLRAAEVPSRALLQLEGSVELLSGDRIEPVGNRIPCRLFRELAMRSDSVFQFEGYFRQVFRADPRRQVLRIGEREVSIGDRIQITRTTPQHLRKLVSSVSGLEDDQFLGFVFAGVDRTGENCLGVDPRSIELAFSELQQAPRVAIDEVGDDSFRVSLQGGSETTSLGRKRYNFVDLLAAQGSIDRVEMEPPEGADGFGFARYEFLDDDGEPVTGFSGRGVRLFVPLVGPGEAISATVRTVGSEELTATAVFRAATGEALEIPVAVWPPVELVEPETSTAPDTQ